MSQRFQLFPNGKQYSAFGGGKAWVIPAVRKTLMALQKFIDFLTSTDQQKALFDKTNEVPANTEARKYAVSKNDELTTAVVDQFKKCSTNAKYLRNECCLGSSATMLFDAVSG